MVRTFDKLYFVLNWLVIDASFGPNCCRAAFFHSSCCRAPQQHTLQVTRYIDKCTLLGERIACVIVLLLLSLSYHAIGAATRRFGRML